ncbi:hypothetical protein BBCT_0420 [Bifidobacterium catenulatum DSM 16992 = JCM 1194 = LMG 11043]|uniref:Uncharacterized protein n=2 Tax=Bifidobacterium catenulatum DSM 16992 = JCM 1194 = LMG 11043 TaxID=566552 RepID=B6XVU1_9BIFI|nr:hypothetical protein BIFCAT_01358 [Bifidobacterium catenulatum DSM 16992 = JCM 1194 = LMG 11043]BAR01388.1 hypothetical protein BBCT_0420 [Bifidobacterium catenulatum DSM 16992 = JCM 1194 = LMG 11043]
MKNASPIVGWRFSLTDAYALRACDWDIRKMRGMPAKYRASAAFPRHLI